MQNIKNRIRDYLEIWWTILVRPIYFYAKMKDDSWQGKSLSFFLVASWILAFAATIIVFVVQYIPVGSTLVEGISGFKFITILPVLLTLMFVFFSITLLISGGFFVFTFFILFYFVALMLHYIYMFLGGKGNLRHMVQSVLYSSAVLLFAILLLSLIILTKYAGLDFSLFRAGFNFFYFLILLYVYGLWAVAGRKTYGVSKWKAFAGALVPVLLLLIFGILFDKIALCKLQSWIT